MVCYICWPGASSHRWTSTLQCKPLGEHGTRRQERLTKAIGTPAIAQCKGFELDIAPPVGKKNAYLCPHLNDAVYVRGFKYAGVNTELRTRPTGGRIDGCDTHTAVRSARVRGAATVKSSATLCVERGRLRTQST